MTPAGQRYAEYARRILGLHDEALLAARHTANPERGTIRLAAVTTAGEHLIPALLASFLTSYPHVTPRLEVGPRSVVWAMLANHEVDMVVAGRPPETIEARIRAVSSNTLVLVGPPSLEHNFDPEGATWLLREQGSGIRATTATLLDQLGGTRGALTLGSHGAVVAAAVAGLGVTLVSRHSVRQHLAEGTLVELAMPGTPMDRPWHLVSHLAAGPTSDLLVDHVLARSELGWRRATMITTA